MPFVCLPVHAASFDMRAGFKYTHTPTTSACMRLTLTCSYIAHVVEILLNFPKAFLKFSGPSYVVSCSFIFRLLMLSVVLLCYRLLYVGIKGTSNPCRYFILRDDIGADLRLTTYYWAYAMFDMCHMYQR